MKDEYASQECAICGAAADGLHYGAISCRSCNAFFRRTVVEKAEYRCKHNNACVIDADGRCSCRSCRFNKCIDAGMKVSAVQPRRDPTGSQRERRKRMAESAGSDSPFDSSFEQSPVSSGADKSDGSYLPRRSSDSISSQENKAFYCRVKAEVEDEPIACTSQDKVPRFDSPPDEDDQMEFRHLVNAFREHQRMMQLSFSTFEQFLEELESGQKLRVMEPADVNKLSAVELTGLLYWIEKIRPYRELPSEDKANLLKRYSVRKLSLDHFYSASKHPEHVALGEFVMNNYTYVARDKTGFELPDDDEKQIEAKRQTFFPTFSRFWTNVIHPFVKLNITDAEIVYLQIMLLWSQTNNEHVTFPTRSLMKQRRDWAMLRLFEWYTEHGFDEPGVRFGQITLLLGEIEIICDMHCQDFQVAKLFEFCDMSKFWYESLCYTPINTNTVKFDPNLFENLKKFTAFGLVDRPFPSPTQAFGQLRRPMTTAVAAAGKNSHDESSSSAMSPCLQPKLEAISPNYTPPMTNGHSSPVVNGQQYSHNENFQEQVYYAHNHAMPM